MKGSRDWIRCSMLRVSEAVAVLPQGLYLPLQAVELGLKLVHHQLDWQGTVHLPVGDLQGGDHRPETDQ
jgi:hypothetical protein